MSLVTSEMTPADIAAVTNNNGNGNGMWGGDSAWWLIVLFLFAFAGNGWGNGFGFGGNGGGNMAVPYMMSNTTNADVQRGFDQASIMGALGDLNVGQVNGFANAQQAMCSGFNGVSQAVSNGFAQSEISANARQMADMQQNFATQTALTQSLNTLQAQLAQCCCDNRAATNDLRYTVATEACADRSAVSDALRDVIASNTANTQAILDKLCQQELEAEKRENANLRSQIQLMQLTGTQDAQTQTLLAGQSANTASILAGQAQRAAEVEQYVNPTAVPAYIVQNPNCCTPQYNTGCGCNTGCGSNF